MKVAELLQLKGYSIVLLKNVFEVRVIFSFLINTCYMYIYSIISDICCIRFFDTRTPKKQHEHAGSTFQHTNTESSHIWTIFWLIGILADAKIQI